MGSDFAAPVRHEFRWPAFATCLAIVTAVSIAATFAQEPSFRVDVQLVRALATVKDTQGKPVGGLRKADFALSDNGVPQQIAVFEPHTEQPLSVGLLIDISGSTAKELKYETESASRFLKALFKEGNPDDRASLYAFNWQVTQPVDYSRAHGRFDRALKSLVAEAGTSMYDAIFLGAEDVAARDGRHVLVIVTDGGDTISTKRFHDALKEVHNADAVLYAILVKPITNDPGRNVGGENALETMTQTTGGRVFMPSIKDLDQVFSDILRELRTQYLIGYYPRGVPSTQNQFHRLEIKVNRPDLRVISRTGYYGDSRSEPPR